jgi:hypothetical protein
MRIGLIILGIFAGLVMIEHAVVPLRIGILMTSGLRPHDAVGGVALFCVWIVATALVYAYPAVAACLFAVAAGFGLVNGLSYGSEELVLWGSIALGMAVLTVLARREKRIADEHELAQERHRLAVHAALRSLQETAPELLSRTPDGDRPDTLPIGPLNPRSAVRAASQASHREAAPLAMTGS